MNTNCEEIAASTQIGKDVVSLDHLPKGVVLRQTDAGPWLIGAHETDWPEQPLISGPTENSIPLQDTEDIAIITQTPHQPTATNYNSCCPSPRPYTTRSTNY